MEKKPVKVRLAEKYAKKTEEPGAVADPKGIAVDAYVAGFDRAKALCVDFVQRYLERTPGMTEDEEALWMKKFTGKVPPSHHMKQIGDLL